MVTMTGVIDGVRKMQGHRQPVVYISIANSAIVATLMVGPSVGGSTFTETVQRGLHWADDSRVWGMLCTTALIVSVVAVISAMSNAHDPTERSITPEDSKNNSVTAEIVAPSMTIVYGLIILAIIATGFVRGQPAAAESSLVLSTSSVKDGDTYSVTAKGFLPGEEVQFSWTGPTRGTMATAPLADSSGSTTLDPIKEIDPPGNYTINATGQKSGHTVSADLRVVQPGN